VSPHSRHRLLAAALVATLAAAWLAPEGADDNATPIAGLTPMPDLLEWPQPPEPPDVSAAPEDATPMTIDRPRQGRGANFDDDTASGRPLTPPTPPFRMFGRLERDGQAVAFITHADQTLTAAAGERLPGEWQVESVGSDGVVLTYLPLGQTARIPFKAPAQ